MLLKSITIYLIFAGTLLLPGILNAQNHNKTYKKAMKAYEKRDYQEARQLFSKAAVEGDPDGLAMIGHLFTINGAASYIRNYDSAISYYKMAEAGNSLMGIEMLAGTYSPFQGAVRDLAMYTFPGSDARYDSLFVHYSRKAVSQGSPYAMQTLYWYFNNKRSTMRGADTLTFYYASLSANAKNDIGMYGLYFCYDKGIGITPDKERAVYWLKKAADNNNAQAKRQLDQLNGKNTEPEYGVFDYRLMAPSADVKEIKTLKRSDIDPAPMSAEAQEAYTRWWQATYGRGGTANPTTFKNENLQPASMKTGQTDEQTRHQRAMDDIQRSRERQQRRDMDNKSR